jgi:hypothetical protein
MIAPIRTYPVRVEHRCPYCETSQGFECEALTDYSELVTCLVCRVPFALTFHVTITCETRKLEGGQRESERNTEAPPKRAKA